MLQMHVNSAPDPAAGAYNAPPDSIVGGGEAHHTLPNALTPVDAVGVSISALGATAPRLSGPQ